MRLSFKMELSKFEEWQASGPGVSVKCVISENSKGKCFWCQNEGQNFSVSVLETKIEYRPDFEDEDVIKRKVENIIKKLSMALTAKPYSCRDHIFRYENEIRAFVERRRGKITELSFRNENA